MMSHRILRLIIGVVTFLTQIGAAFGATVPSSNGIYAKFRVTRSDALVAEFVASLDYVNAPKTVANFVGLAEGSRAWVDQINGGLKKKAYYDGLTFHRVVANFVLQGGSPKGDGSDGPGYTFEDEFDPSLRHSGKGVLSMANSGLHSNGSQFFVTLAATSWLDDVHSVFGNVQSADLAQLDNVAEDDIIESITIIRNGTAAQSFDVDAHGLPQVLDAGATLTKNGANFSLSYDQTDDTAFFLYSSPDLQNWSSFGTEFFTYEPTDTPKTITPGSDMEFFSVGKVVYPIEIQTPYHPVGTQINMDTQSGFRWSVAFTGGGSGLYATSVAPGQSFTMTAFTWQQEAYRALLSGYFQGAIQFNGTSGPVTFGRFSLVYTSPAGGSFKGTLYNIFNEAIPFDGSFSVQVLP